MEEKTEEKKNTTADNKIDSFVDSFGLPMFCLYLFCLGLPFLVNFREINIFPKVLMIIGSVLAICVTVLLWIVSIKERNKKMILAPIIFSVIFVFSFIHYFNFELWGLRKYEVMLIACTAVLGGLAMNGYSISKFFSKDKLIRALIVIAFVFAVLGLFLVENPKYHVRNNILFQVSIGLIYLYVLLTLIETYLLGKPKIKVNKKYESSFLLLKAIIVIAAIFTLPLYLSWIGLSDNIIDKFIVIYASVLGGVITLAGVAWTIKSTTAEKKEEEIKKAKPVVFISNPENVNSEREKPINRTMYSNNKRGTIMGVPNKKNKFYTLPLISISNSDYSHCTVIGFRINDEYHIYDVGQVLPKNSLIRLNSDFKFELKDEVKYVAILLMDMLENIYELEIKSEIEKYRKENIIHIISGIEIKKTTLNINPKEI